MYLFFCIIFYFYADYVFYVVNAAFFVVSPSTLMLIICVEFSMYVFSSYLLDLSCHKTYSTTTCHSFYIYLLYFSKKNVIIVYSKNALVAWFCSIKSLNIGAQD